MDLQVLNWHYNKYHWTKHLIIYKISNGFRYTHLFYNDLIFRIKIFFLKLIDLSKKAREEDNDVAAKSHASARLEFSVKVRAHTPGFSPWMNICTCSRSYRVRNLIKQRTASTYIFTGSKHDNVPSPVQQRVVKRCQLGRPTLRDADHLSG